MQLKGRPTEFQCLLIDAPVGMFVHHLTGEVGIKTNQKERNDDQKDECVCVASPNPAHVGGMFLGGTSGFVERDALTVVPCVLEWVED